MTFRVAQSGTDDTKWMTPLKVKQAISYNVNQIFPVGNKGAALVDSRFITFSVSRSNTNFIRNDPRFFYRIYNSWLDSTSSDKRIQVSAFYYDTSNHTFGTVTNFGSIPVASLPEFIYDRSDCYREYAPPYIVTCHFRISSSGNSARRLILNLSSKTLYYSEVGSSSSYIPSVVWGYDKTYFYLVNQSGSSCTIERFNSSGTKTNTYTATLPFSNSYVSILSLNTDSNGGFLIGYNTALVYVRPSSSSTVTSVSGLVNGCNNPVCYNGYFYSTAFQSNGVRIILRYSPGSSSFSTKSTPISGYAPDLLTVLNNGAFMCRVTNTSVSNDSRFLYGSSISSFFTSNSYTILKNRYGNPETQNIDYMDNYGYYSTNMVSMYDGRILDIRNSTIRDGYEFITKGGNSDPGVMTTSSIYFNTASYPIDFSKDVR